jgi:ParB family transcriptional regulator, chromosome partitioning protein
MSKRTIERMSGLDDLFGNEENIKPTSTLPIVQIILPPSQPRRYFDQEKLESLASSIKEVGLLEPIVVRPTVHNNYELIAGERRLKACEIAEIENIAVNIIECDDTAASRIRLVENLQREDLNVYEETVAILELLTILLDFETEEVISTLNRMMDEEKGKVPHNVMGRDESLTIQDLFSKLGKITWQSFVSNRLPVIRLNSDIKEVLSRGDLEYTKALAISKIKDDSKRAEVLKQAIDEKLSLSKIRELVDNSLAGAAKNKEKPLSKKKEVSSRFSQISKTLKNSEIWDKPQELKQLVKALSQIEKLLALSEGNVNKIQALEED